VREQVPCVVAGVLFGGFGCVVVVCFCWLVGWVSGGTVFVFWLGATGSLVLVVVMFCRLLSAGAAPCRSLQDRVTSWWVYAWGVLAFVLLLASVICVFG